MTPTAGDGNEEPRAEGSDTSTSEEHVLSMARGGALNMAGTLTSQISFFLITLIIARQLGRSAVGNYSQAFAFLAILELVSLSGFRAGLTRFIAVHRVEKDESSLRGTLRVGLGLSLIGAVVLSAILAAGAPWLAHHAFHDPQLTLAFRFVALVLPCQVMTDAALSATQGYMTMRPYALIGLIFEPVLRLSLTATALALGKGLPGTLTSLVISNGIAAVLALIALRRLRGKLQAKPQYRVRNLFSFSMVSWLASFASTGLIWADTIIIGIYRPSREVGIYNIATRVVLLGAFAMTPINNAFAPRIAKLYQQESMANLKRTYAAATGWILRLSLPAFVVCLVYPKELLSLFGRGFVVGASVTMVLAVGKLMDSATGPCGLMLNMSGRPALSLYDNVGVLILNVVLNIFLIPRYGIVGAAYAWAIALWVVNIFRVWQVWAVMHMVPFDISELKGLFASVLAGVAGLAARGVARGHVELIVGCVTICVVYFAAVQLFGVSSNDRLLLSAVTQRRIAPVHAKSARSTTSDSPTLAPVNSKDRRWPRISRKQST
jgi:O-antigen/teichoic acid export membrane protein